MGWGGTASVCVEGGLFLRGGGVKKSFLDAIALLAPSCRPINPMHCQAISFSCQNKTMNYLYKFRIN